MSPTSPVQQPTCPNCEASLMNVQGLDFCDACGWMPGH